MFGAIKNRRQTLRKAAERAAATLARAVRIQISQMLSPARVFGAIIPAQLFGIVNLRPTVYFRMREARAGLPLLLEYCWRWAVHGSRCRGQVRGSVEGSITVEVFEVLDVFKDLGTYTHPIKKGSKWFFGGGSQ
jgi:hypothetical protein